MRSLLCLVLVAGCGVSNRGGFDALGMHGDGGERPADLGGKNGQMGCGEVQGCYTVWAHSDHTLYHVDLPNKLLVTVGAFKAPQVLDPQTNKMVEDVIQDLAVAPDDTIYVVSRAALYVADPNDGHVTQIGALTACGQDAVALTFTPDGSLYSGDYKGAFCRIDLTAQPPRVTQVGTLGPPNTIALAGDMVAVADGTIYGTAYNQSDTSTQTNNLLVKIDPTTGHATTIGKTGFPKMFGAAFAQGQVFGFTHDGSGTVVTIDPKSGVGTLYKKFTDPSTGMGISFAGAGVNSMVSPTIM